VTPTLGNLLEARPKHDEVRPIRNKLAEKATIAPSQLALARISIEEGHPEKAEPLAQQAAETFRTIKADQSIPSAGDVLTQSLLGQGKIAEAQKTINEVRAIAAKIEDLDASFPVAITAARVSAASGKFAEAKKLLNSTLAAVSRYGYINLGLEARLALGEIEMKSGQTASGRARLEALEKEAQVKGFGLVAKKAKAAKT
jgi:tetratricopeptide (TPR) repeat protein